MKRAINIQQDLAQIHTIEDLTEVFEGIASMRIAKIRDRVVASKDFFAQLWQIYSSLRVDPHRQLKQRRQHARRDMFIAVTSEGKLSGTLDEQIIESLLQAAGKNPAASDILVVGTHGLSQLEQRGVRPAKAFHMPPQDEAFNVANVIEALQPYRLISVFYQAYESLREQKVARIELVSAVRSLGDDVGDTGDIVSPGDYIFEPDLQEIVEYMEGVMLGVALIQVVMESKLAQYASRFNSMSAAKRRAGDISVDLRREFYRAKRGESDDRLKEVMKVVKYRERRAV